MIVDDGLYRIRDLGSEIWDLGSGIRDPGPVTWDLGSGIWHPGSGIRDLGSGIWDPGSGICDLGSGIWDPGSGIRDLGSGSEYTTGPRLATNFLGIAIWENWFPRFRCEAGGSR